LVRWRCFVSLPFRGSVRRGLPRRPPGMEEEVDAGEDDDEAERLPHRERTENRAERIVRIPELRVGLPEQLHRRTEDAVPGQEYAREQAGGKTDPPALRHQVDRPEDQPQQQALGEGLVDLGGMAKRDLVA